MRVLICASATFDGFQGSGVTLNLARASTRHSSLEQCPDPHFGRSGVIIMFELKQWSRKIIQHISHRSHIEQVQICAVQEYWPVNPTTRPKLRNTLSAKSMSVVCVNEFRSQTGLGKRLAGSGYSDHACLFYYSRWTDRCGIVFGVRSENQEECRGKTEAWKQRSGSIGHRTWLHGNELVIRSAEREAGDDFPAPCGG